jgi:predicted kinase
MPKIILLVGVPGSGKSTLAQKIVAKGFHYMNADSIREELYGKAIEQGNPEDVFKIFFERLEQAMADGKSIIVDNTNCNPRHRKQILDRCATFNYDDVQLWLLDVPLATCLERNRGRERAVPEDAVTNIYNELQRNGRPKRSEGKVVVLRPSPDGKDYLFFPQS